MRKRAQVVQDEQREREDDERLAAEREAFARTLLGQSIARMTEAINAALPAVNRQALAILMSGFTQKPVDKQSGS